MPTSRHRAGLALALAASLSIGLAGGAVAAPKPKPAPSVSVKTKATPPPVTKVAPQVQLAVTPAKKAAYGTYVARITVKAPANTKVEGTYRLLEGATVLGEGTLVAGTASVTVVLPDGSHTLNVVYSGSAKVNGASVKTVVVTPFVV